MVVGVLLTILSCLVIHALMLSNVDEKTFEFGMLRTQGLFRSNLYKIIFAEALSFSIPGLIIGFILSTIFYTFFVFMLCKTLYAELDYKISLKAIILGLFIGILAPIFSVLEPVYRALSKTLRDSLDLYRKNISDLKITFIKLEKLRISTTLTVIAVFFVVAGYATYNFIPYLFIFQKMGEFIMLLNIILLLLVIGVTILVHRVQGFCARSILHIIIFIYRRDKGMKPIALKSLKSHEQRNHRVALIFSLTVAFLLLGGSIFYNQR